MISKARRGEEPVAPAAAAAQAKAKEVAPPAPATRRASKQDGCLDARRSAHEAERSATPPATLINMPWYQGDLRLRRIRH
jgi:hypothetical protein